MVDQHRLAREAGARGGDDFIDDRVVLEHEMNPRGAAHRVGRGRGRLDAERGQGLDFARGTVPRGDAVAALGGGFREGAAEQPGS